MTKIEQREKTNINKELEIKSSMETLRVVFGLKMMDEHPKEYERYVNEHSNEYAEFRKEQQRLFTSYIEEHSEEFRNFVFKKEINVDAYIEEHLQEFSIFLELFIGNKQFGQYAESNSRDFHEYKIAQCKLFGEYIESHPEQFNNKKEIVLYSDGQELEYFEYLDKHPEEIKQYVDDHPKEYENFIKWQKNEFKKYLEWKQGEFERFMLLHPEEFLKYARKQESEIKKCAKQYYKNLIDRDLIDTDRLEKMFFLTKDFTKEIDALSVKFVESKQEKFSANGLLGDINFISKMGLTVEDQIVQEDFFYGDDLHLKIRKVSGAKGDRYVLVYKSVNEDDKQKILAFDISEEVFGQVRERYKSVKQVRKTRTIFKSNNDIAVTCDSDISFMSDNNRYFHTDNSIYMKNGEPVIYKNEPYVGEIWELSRASNKLEDAYEATKRTMLEYTIRGKKVLNLMKEKSISELFK